MGTNLEKMRTVIPAFFFVIPALAGISLVFSVKKTEYTVHPCDVMLEFKIPQLDASDKRPEKVTERGTEKVTENQAIIIREMEKDSFITAVSLAKILGISLRKTKENIKKLQQKGLIRRIGPDKGGHWQITEN